MKTTLICPIYNEKESVEELIKSILNQTKKPDEIIFVDNFSNDGTAEIIKKYKEIKLIQEKSNISKARNIAIQNSKNEIIAGTDASCKLDKNWLKNITEPFKDKKIDVVSGGYIATSKKGLSEYISMITIKPMKEWKKDFLPSSRSIAFRKKAWKSVNGYPENLYTGEDTCFNLKLKEKGLQFKLAKNAILHWETRDNIPKFVKQFYLYGKGDGESKNILKLKNNLIFFIGLNILILGTLIFLFLKPLISFILLSTLLFYLILNGIKYTIKKKKIKCLFWIPILMFFKRFSYFFGVWEGLLR